MVARGNETCCLAADSASRVVRTGGPEPQGVEGVGRGVRGRGGGADITRSGGVAFSGEGAGSRAGESNGHPGSLLSGPQGLSIGLRLMTHIHLPHPPQSTPLWLFPSISKSCEDGNLADRGAVANPFFCFLGLDVCKQTKASCTRLPEHLHLWDK